MKRLLVLGLIIGLIVGAYELSVERAEADHGVVRCGSTGMQACIVASSPFVNNVIKTQGEVRYCIDNRGLNYPGFRAQVATVMAQYALDLKVSGTREVAYGDPTCNVKNSMRDDHPCSGCGAWIYVSAYPLLIEYNAKQAYTRWDSTIGHETGHGFCLLDEHYDKVNFRSWILNYGYWQHGEPTVMDGGTPFLAAYAPLGIWYPTEYDLDRCEESIGRDLDAAPVVYPYMEGNTWYACDPALPDSQCYWSRYVLGDQWYDKNGNPEWDPKVDIYYPNGGYAGYQQWNRRLVERFFVGQTVWSDKGEGWQCASFCF